MSKELEAYGVVAPGVIGFVRVFKCPEEAAAEALRWKYASVVTLAPLSTQAGEGWRDIATAPDGMVLVPREQTIELIAEYIYDQWKCDPHYVPWARGGNSNKQESAREIARTVVSLAVVNKPLPSPPSDTKGA